MSEVNQERQRAAGRARIAEYFQYILAEASLVGGMIGLLNAYVAVNAQEWRNTSAIVLATGVSALLLALRGRDNRARRGNLLDTKIQNGDLRARTRRDYCQELKGFANIFHHPPRMW